MGGGGRGGDLCTWTNRALLAGAWRGRVARISACVTTSAHHVRARLSRLPQDAERVCRRSPTSRQHRTRLRGPDTSCPYGMCPACPGYCPQGWRTSGGCAYDNGDPALHALSAGLRPRLPRTTYRLGSGRGTAHRLAALGKVCGYGGVCTATYVTTGDDADWHTNRPANFGGLSTDCGSAGVWNSDASERKNRKATRRVRIGSVSLYKNYCDVVTIDLDPSVGFEHKADWF